MPRFSCCHVTLAVAALSLAVGCSKKADSQLPVHPVAGQVLFNGQPAVGAFVVFHPKTKDGNLPTPNAVVDKQGNYSLSTYTASDGAPAGEYNVSVVWHAMIQKDGEFQPGPNRLPAHVANPSTSKIAARIGEGANSVPIKITR